MVIPAHDEAAVIGRCLDALFTGFLEGELDVVVVCNGCSDETAALARSSRHPVRVAKLRSASKPAALRWGDAAAREFPRLYLDADVVLPGPQPASCWNVSGPGRSPLGRRSNTRRAARPRRCAATIALGRRFRPSWVRSGVQACMGSLQPAGAASAPFPDVVADDLWVDRLFDEGEVEIVDSAPVVVPVPRRSRDLLRVLRRTYRGKREMAFAPDLRDSAPETVVSTLRDLGRVAVVGPAAAVDAATYAAFAAGARLALALPHRGGAPLTGEPWERDHSTRAA